MHWFYNSFNGKISALFLLLLVVVSSIQMWVMIQSYRTFVHESDQRLNHDLAENLGTFFHPYLADSLHYDAIEHTIHEFMVINPHVEIYLLDEQGGLLAYFADPQKIKRMQLDIAPIHLFLENSTDGPFPIYGDDPKSQKARKPFSVSSVMIGPDQAGYLYVILGGELYDSASAVIRESYITRITMSNLTAVVVCTGLLGLLLFWLLTKRVRGMTVQVQQFTQGEMDQRVPIAGQDEVGQLGLAFNQMADTIDTNIKNLKQMDQQRRELVANISHDLRSPLTSMQGYMETILMKEASLTPAERKNYLDTVFKNIQSLNKLVQELFELSKLESDQTPPCFEPCSIEELVQDVVLKYQPESAKRQIALVPPVYQALPYVYADIALIERVLCNLIENALHATSDNGKIAIELVQRSHAIEISVVDNGCGIPAVDLPQIFNRYYTLCRFQHPSPSDHDKRKRGTGLGLAISQKIVEAHHSTLKVKSKEFEGSTFSFLLPLTP